MSVISLLDVRIREDRLADAPAVVHDVLAATRAFDGNTGVQVARDATDEAHWVIVEHWASIEHDDAYRAWRATPEGASALGELLAGAPTLTRSVVDDSI
ncbi:antibiotic biosynthesis monooxygenase [Cnuibacter physcomitrellae]|uniref:ABM domain-containing protein n=1 Tax=Cnuibacter physcomitrellae TaxID=1619308 RepID=A0A1X9LGT1_9MICO|nr:antibiotic biosynthesis monooxygenase [Cnuibacter physcomitrellae]ARJ04426.1 hypothetical protein B5808_03700 [Cnuibacter physcomitrellae]GGI41026.1 antibiotic biosynthesis monooxygenase [Cnuibacter physcomitrellae]